MRFACRHQRSKVISPVPMTRYATSWGWRSATMRSWSGSMAMVSVRRWGGSKGTNRSLA